MSCFRLIAKTSLDKRGIVVKKFNNNLPGDDWARSLLKRHKALTQRITTNISRCRAEISPTTINSYFDNLSTVLKDIPAENIFNYDESNLQDDPGKKKFLFKRGTKYPVQVQNHSKSATTIMVCGSASGILLPPYIIYKSKNLWESWTNGGPKGSPCCDSSCCSKGTRYNCTPHGWMDGITFKEWFFTTFLPHANHLPGRKVLIGDNLASHFNPEVIQQCEDSGIDFVCLPKNATHLTQPLDVCFFRPLKQSWRFCLNEWKNRNTTMQSIPKSSFPALVSSCLQRINDVGSISNNLKSGFRATGIYPLDRNAILQKLPNEDDPNINDIVVNYLKDKRFEKTDKNRKRKKINVAPGQSVTSATLNNEDSDNDSSNVVIPYVDTDSEHELENEDVVPEYQKPTKENLNIGDFVLVNVQLGKRKKTIYVYAAVIKNIVENIYTLNGLKSLDDIKQIFKIQNDDIFDVDIIHIIAILKIPKLTKEANYIFSHPLSDVREAK